MQQAASALNAFLFFLVVEILFLFEKEKSGKLNT